MDIVSQNVSQGEVEHVSEGVVGQDAPPPVGIHLAGHAVPDCKGAIGRAHMKHIARSHLHRSAILSLPDML